MRPSYLPALAAVLVLAAFVSSVIGTRSVQAVARKSHPVEPTQSVGARPSGDAVADPIEARAVPTAAPVRAAAPVTATDSLRGSIGAGASATGTGDGHVLATRIEPAEATGTIAATAALAGAPVETLAVLPRYRALVQAFTEAR